MIDLTFLRHRKACMRNVIELNAVPQRTFGPNPRLTDCHLGHNLRAWTAGELNLSNKYAVYNYMMCDHITGNVEGVKNVLVSY